MSDWRSPTIRGGNWLVLAIIALALMAMPAMACYNVGVSYGYSYPAAYSFALPYVPTINYIAPPQVHYAVPAPCVCPQQVAAPLPQQTYAAPAPVQQEVQQTYAATTYAAPAPAYSSYGGSYDYAVGAPLYVRSRACTGFVSHARFGAPIHHVGRGNVAVVAVGARHGFQRRGALAVAPVAPRRIVTRTRTVTRIR